MGKKAVSVDRLYWNLSAPGCLGRLPGSPCPPLTWFQVSGTAALGTCLRIWRRVRSVPSASSSVYHPSLSRSHGYKQPFICILGIGTERCLPVSPKTEFVSSCVTEERELETSFEVRAVFWLRKSRGGLDSWNTGFEVRHSWVWIQPAVLQVCDLEQVH